MEGLWSSLLNTGFALDVASSVPVLIKSRLPVSDCWTSIQLTRTTFHDLRAAVIRGAPGHTICVMDRPFLSCAGFYACQQMSQQMRLSFATLAPYRFQLSKPPICPPSDCLKLPDCFNLLVLVSW